MTHILLTSPLSYPNLDRVRVAAYKLENNIAEGRLWAELWAVLGYLEDDQDESSFRQVFDPRTGEEVFIYVKMENAMHPLRPGFALGKCSDCAFWYNRTSGDCDQEGCTGTVRPYDGMSRLLSVNLGAGTHGGQVETLVYLILTAEQVPDAWGSFPTDQIGPMVAGTITTAGPAPGPTPAITEAMVAELRTGIPGPRRRRRG